MKTKTLLSLLFLAKICIGQVSLEIKNFEWTEHSTENFSIPYPNKWELSIEKTMGTSFIILTPQEDKNDNFRENVNLIIQDISRYNLNLDSYTALSIEQIKNLIPNSKLEISKRYENFHEVVYTGQQGKFNLKFKQRYWIIEGRAYVLTFTTEQKTWDTYLNIGNKILEGFKIN